MKVTDIDITDIIPYANNPRNNAAAIDAVAASIREFGFKVPVVIDRNNILITGHTRLEAAKKLGITKIPAIRAADLTDAQVKAFRLADNKVSEIATWDDKALAAELQALDDMDFDMSDFGFADDELREDIENLEDPEVPEGATTETPVSGTPVPDTVSGKYTSDTVTVPGSPASDQGDSLPGALTGASDDGNATAGSQDPSLYNPEFDTETGGASGGADDDSLEPNAGGTGDSGLPGGAESLSGPREASGEFSGNGDLPAPDGAVASHGTGEFREDSGGSGSAGAPGEPGSPGNPGSYLKISYRDIGPSEEEGGRRVAYTVTDENNNVRCSLRGRVAGIDRGRVFFIDENVKIGNGCDISSFPKEMLCYDSDGSFCRAIPRNGGQKGFVQYVKLSKDKS